MSKLVGKAVFVDKYESQKVAKDYLTFVDTETGGQLKLTADRGRFKFDIGEAVNLDVQIRPFTLMGGGLALTVVGGSITPVKATAK